MSYFARLIFVVPLLLARYLTVAQDVSDSYITEKAYLDSLIEHEYFSEAIQYTLSTPPTNNLNKYLYTFQRNRSYLKQRKVRPEIRLECLSLHKELSGETDSIYVYLDARVLELLGHYYYQRNNTLVGLNYLDSAAIKYNLINVYDGSIYNLNMIGTIHYLNDDLAKGARYLNSAIQLFKEHPVDSSYYFELILDLGNIYSDLEEIDDANQYYRTIYDDPNIIRYPDVLADVYANLGNIAQQKDFFEEAKHFYDQALQSYSNLGDSASMASVLHNLGSLVQDSLPNQALDYYNRSFQIKTAFADYGGMANSLYAISRLLYLQKDYQESKKYALDGLNYSMQSPHRSSLAEIYLILSQIEAHYNNYELAYNYNTQYREIADSISKVNQLAAISRIEELYNLEEQQRIIESFEETSQKNAARLRKSKVINYALGGASFLLIVVLVLLMSNFQQIQKTKNTLFKKNLEVAAAEALVNGQEEERQRLAHQLHDKVGNHITVLKNHILARGSGDDELMAIVQDMSAEVRNISQDLMPPVLERFGLGDALEELCARYRDQMQATIDLNIDQGEIIPIDNEDQINLYRLIQEVIQISLFHYKANYLLMDMKWNTKGIWVSIEDNGTRKPRALDEEMVLRPWKTIEHRVQFLKGEFKRSNHNQGNEYQLYIPKRKL